MAFIRMNAIVSYDEFSLSCNNVQAFLDCTAWKYNLAEGTTEGENRRTLEVFFGVNPEEWTSEEVPSLWEEDDVEAGVEFLTVLGENMTYFVPLSCLTLSPKG